jgi:hypothetical protein
MRRSRPSCRASAIVALLIAASACGPEREPDELPAFSEPERCAGESGADGASAPRSVTLGAAEGDDFIPYADGQTATVVLGYQGGYMITPSLEVPAGPADGAEACWRVHLQNALEDGGAAVPGLLSHVVFGRSGELFRAGPFNDLLGNDASKLADHTLVLTVTVTGSDFEGTQTLHLQLRQDG